MRKKSIKNYIEQQFNWANKVMPTGEEVREKVKQLPDLPDWSVSTLSPPRARDPFSVEYTERVQSFFPTCTVARKMKLLLQCPEDPKIDILFYKIRFPRNRDGSKVQVNAAKLRLYKLGLGRESKLRITVFWLKLRNSGISPATQVMLDSVMEDGASEGWVSLDVTGAVADWLKHQHKPMALMIKVEDDRQRELFSRSVMQTLTCDNEINSHLKRKLPYHQPIPMFDESNHIQTHNAEKQPLIDVSTIEIPDGEDIPDNIMIWGLPKTSSLDTDTVPYSGNVQNVEILHKPRENVKYFNLTEEGKNGTGNILQTIEEVDFLGGVKDDSVEAQDQDQYHSLHEVVLSREELEMKLKEMRKNVEANENDLSDKIDELEAKQKMESEFYKKLFISLMTEKQKHNEFEFE